MINEKSNPDCWATGWNWDELRTLFSAAQRDLFEGAHSFPPSMWNRTGAGGAWSASQICEHVFLVEKALCNLIQLHLVDEPHAALVPLMSAKKEMLLRVLPNRGQAVSPPSFTVFTGLRLDQVDERIGTSQIMFDELLHEMRDLPVHAIAWRHTHFGELSAYLWALYVPLHTMRHVGQLRRLRQEIEMTK